LQDENMSFAGNMPFADSPSSNVRWLLSKWAPLLLQVALWPLALIALETKECLCSDYFCLWTLSWAFVNFLLEDIIFVANQDIDSFTF